MSTTPNAFGVNDDLGVGGKDLSPDGASGKPGEALRDLLRKLFAAQAVPVADTTALTNSLAVGRGDGQLVTVLADYSTWVWKAADATVADATHIAPTDVAAGAGRWVKTGGAGGTDTGEVQKVSTTLNLAAIQALTSGTAFNVGAVLPANARLVGAEIIVTTPVTGGTLSAVAATVQGGADAAGSILATQSVFAAAGTFAPAGSNPYLSRGGQQIKATLTATGDTLAHATAGALTVNVFYAIDL